MIECLYLIYMKVVFQITVKCTKQYLITVYLKSEEYAENASIKNLACRNKITWLFFLMFMLKKNFLEANCEKWRLSCYFSRKKKTSTNVTKYLMFTSKGK